MDAVAQRYCSARATIARDRTGARARAAGLQRTGDVASDAICVVDRAVRGRTGWGVVVEAETGKGVKRMKGVKRICHEEMKVMKRMKSDA